MKITDPCKLMPIYELVSLTKEGLLNKKGRIDKRKIAINIANHLLENGYIVEHEPIARTNADLYDLRFVLYSFKPQRDLP